MKAQIAIPETFLHDIDIEALGYKYFWYLTLSVSSNHNRQLTQRELCIGNENTILRLKFVLHNILSQG